MPVAQIVRVYPFTVRLLQLWASRQIPSRHGHLLGYVNPYQAYVMDTVLGRGKRQLESLVDEPTHMEYVDRNHDDCVEHQCSCLRAMFPPSCVAEEKKGDFRHY
jgi:hypothetical protein